MTRALLLGMVVMAAACGGKTFQSLCANQVPPPAACATACDPAPGATTPPCPDGYHCGAASMCDAVCTITGGQCGDGYACTTDGNCVSSSSGSNPGGSNTDTDACPSAHFTAAKTTPSIQLLVDRSGSMLDLFNKNMPASATNPEKYATVQDALVGGTGVVATLQGSVYFGSTLFSADPNVACPTLKPVQRVMNNLQAIKDSISMNRPVMNAATPTAKSIDAVVQDFKTNQPPAGSPPIILLATDGLPNDCSGGKDGPTQTVSAAQAAFTAGVKLYYLFVGDLTTLPNDNKTHPQQMANAGAGQPLATGTAKFYNATDPTTLATALSDIIKGVLSCDLQLSSKVNADQTQNGTVTLDGVTLTYGTDWTVDPDGITLHILGNKCTQLKGEPNPVVNATFSCGAVIIF